MKIFFLTLIAISFFAACNQTKIDKTDIKNDLSLSKPVVLETPEAVSNSLDSTKDDSLPYPGITIDQQFPFLENHDFREEDFNGKSYSIKVDDFQVAFDNFKPKTIQDKNGKELFKFKTLFQNEYSSDAVGISHLLGADSKEIYVVSQTGGVCCINYWITDISNGNPRNIFRSEDYGYFRHPLEVFDADGDGIYEIVQFDSTFRYFMDDCGACSPEPRAVFKYNKKLGQYLPAKHIQQDFVKKNVLEKEKWILESFEKLETFEKSDDTKNQEYRTLLLDYNRRFLDYIVDTFYLGNETKAWKTFEKYYNGYNQKEEVREEIKKRLNESKFYQALKKS